MSKTKSALPPVPFVQNRSPAIGTRIKVWFDKPSRNLLIEDEAGKVSQDIYGVCLGDVEFNVETTSRGAIRCFVVGTFLAVPGSAESLSIQRQMHTERGRYLEFYWWRDRAWPISRARLAFIARPHGGFPTNLVVDSVAREA